MGALLAPFGIGAGCQAFLQARQSGAAQRNPGSADAIQRIVEHEGSFPSVLGSQVIGLPSQPDVPPEVQHAGTDAGGSSEPAPPAGPGEIMLEEDKTWQLFAASQRDEHGWTEHDMASSQSNTDANSALTASSQMSPQLASFYLSLCCVQRLADEPDLLPERHAVQTTTEALAEITLRVLHEHDFDLEGMEEARRSEVPLPPPRPRPARPVIKAPLDDSSTSADFPSAQPAAEATVQRKKARRARILQDGRLTMILYGADEALKWQMRVSRFLQAARGVLGDRRRVPGQWAGSVLDSVVGVFLTQNVSDALSSKAWMTLAATFPLAATGNQQQERGGSSVAGDALTGTARITCNGQLDCEQGVEYLCETAGEKAPAANASDVASHDRRCRDTADSIDWEAVRAAQTDEVAAAIKCRGMHNKLAARLQSLLNQIATIGPGLRTVSKDDGVQKDGLAEVSDVEEPPSKRQRTEAPAPQQVSPDKRPSGSLGYPCPTGGIQAVGGLARGLQTSDEDTLVQYPASIFRQSGDEEIANALAGAGGMQAIFEPANEVHIASSPSEGVPIVPGAAAAAQMEEFLVAAGDGGHCNSLLQGKECDEQDAEMTSACEAVEAEAAPDSCLPAATPSVEAMAVCEDRAMEEGEVHPMTLEWLRDVAEDNARQYLMGVMGLGRKSVACVMLLALCKHDFPVDTNVGRICARLGWIPLDAEEALEDLDRYAPEPEVHKYLHSRLMHFDLDTLYELHYQMITLGKVFCSKRNPNCSACPLRPQCEYAQANGRHLKKMPGPSNMPTPEATPAQAQPSTPEPARSSQHQPGSDSPGADALQADSSRAQDAASGQLKGTGSGGEQEHAQEASSEAADLPEGPCTPCADRRADITREKRQSLLEALDGRFGRPETTTKSTEGSVGISPQADNSDTLGSQGAEEEKLACQVEAALPDIEDLEREAAPSKAPRMQSQELARILETGEGYERAVSMGQDTDPSSIVNVRTLEAAAAVLDIQPVQSSGVEEDIVTCLQDYGAKAIRRRFKELSVVVHPDKCTLTGARQAFEHLRRAQEVLISHVSPQHDRDQEEAAPNSVSAGDPGRGQYVLLQGHEIPASYHGLLNPAMKEHHISDDLPLLLLPLPAHTCPPEKPTGKVDKSVAVALLNTLLQGRITNAGAASAGIASVGALEQLPGKDSKSGAASGTEKVQEDGTGAASSSEAAVPQPKYALLVPCRTAMRSRFPLNGTYFQVNEVFLDDTSLRSPIQVAAEVVGEWVRRPVYFGTSVVNVCRGMRQAEVTRFFSDGLLCVRAFDPLTRYPRPLPNWALPGKAPKAPATPPAADRPRGKGAGKDPSLAIVPVLRAALDVAAPLGTADPSQALVVVGASPNNAGLSAPASGQRVKRKYTRRAGAASDKSVAVKSGVWKPGATVRTAHAALLPMRNVQAADQPAAAQTTVSSGMDGAAASGPQPAPASEQAAPVQSPRPDCRTPKQLVLEAKKPERCGHCLNCLFPTRHEACIVR